MVGGANCRGPQKVVRLRAWLDARYGDDIDVELWAYGDSSGDEELLAFADHPTWIGKRARRADPHVWPGTAGGLGRSGVAGAAFTARQR